VVALAIGLAFESEFVQYRTSSVLVNSVFNFFALQSAHVDERDEYDDLNKFHLL
jgi:hypothetical protein